MFDLNRFDEMLEEIMPDDLREKAINITKAGLAGVEEMSREELMAFAIAAPIVILITVDPAIKVKAAQALISLCEIASECLTSELPSA